MKLTTILLLIANLHVYGIVFSQDIVLSEKNVSLSIVLQKIRQQSGYQLLYNADPLEVDCDALLQGQAGAPAFRYSVPARSAVQG